MKKKFSKASSLNLRSPTTVVPDVMRTRLSYNTYVSLSGGAISTPFSQIYQNSCFDPDQTGSGNQPLGFDEWAAFYSKYRVNAMAITVVGSNTNGTFPMVMSVYPTLSASVPGSVNGVLSVPYAKVTSSGISGGNGKIFIKNFMTTKKIWGFKSIDQEDNFSSLVSTDPTNLWYWVVYGYCGIGANTTPTFQGTIKITYYVEFFDRRQLNIS